MGRSADGLAAAVRRASTLLLATVICGATAVLLSSVPGRAESAPTAGDGASAPPSVGITGAFDGSGYWSVDIFGSVLPGGKTTYFGSMTGQPLNAHVTNIAATPDGKGYWLVGSDGGIFAFGDAGFYGSMAGQHLNAPVVDIASTKDGKGYWLVGSDGGIFAFGDAGFHGSMGWAHLNNPIVGISPDDATGGYWEVASDGGVFAIGAPFFGSTGALSLAQPVTGIAATADGNGYWFAAADGGVFAFGDAPFYGSLGGQPLSAPIVGMASDFPTGGYWLLDSNGVVRGFNAPIGRPLPVTVTSVTPTTTPYDPTRASAGYPAEQVDFTVGSSPTGGITCQIEIVHNGAIVGSTVAGIGLAAGARPPFQLSVTVDVSGDNFNGTPSNAQVSCYQP
jgi:hypothetical protein